MSAAQVLTMPPAATQARVVVVASADTGLRERLRTELAGMRWTVHEAGGGAEALALTEESRAEAVLVDSWLPDLEAEELGEQMRSLYPELEVLGLDGGGGRSGVARSPRRNELLHAIRAAQDAGPLFAVDAPAGEAARVEVLPEQGKSPVAGAPVCASIEGMVGESAGMRELARLIRLVAPRSATVLIEGETGTGKELVAKAIHRLSTRAAKPFVVLNCAAIPESLLEAELFGHTRGAFTGAVTSRTGRIEAAHGGTLFLDEIGEMPLALQAKMLRFLEYGELQRVGDNETMRVDVRVVAATHQPLEQRAEEGRFRLDLYHRLAVFPVEVPSLRERLEDVPRLVDFFLEQMGRDSPRKRVSAGVMEMLQARAWPGNVRELMHVLERGGILAGDSAEIGIADIRLRRRG